LRLIVQCAALAAAVQDRVDAIEEFLTRVVTLRHELRQLFDAELVHQGERSFFLRRRNECSLLAQLLDGDFVLLVVSGRRFVLRLATATRLVFRGFVGGLLVVAGAASDFDASAGAATVRVFRYSCKFASSSATELPLNVMLMFMCFSRVLEWVMQDGIDAANDASPCDSRCDNNSDPCCRLDGEERFVHGLSSLLCVRGVTTCDTRVRNMSRNTPYGALPLTLRLQDTGLWLLARMSSLSRVLATITKIA
jgi:hypothetical protein